MIERGVRCNDIQSERKKITSAYSMVGFQFRSHCHVPINCLGPMIRSGL